MSGRWRAIGEAFRTLRRVHLVFELSQVQIHQAGDSGSFLFASRMQGRDRRQEVETWESFLRLFRISKLQRGLLGQARARDVSAVQRTVSAREDDEETGHLPLLRGRKLWLPLRAD